MTGIEVELSGLGDELQAAAVRDLARSWRAPRRRTLIVLAAAVAVLGLVGAGIAATVFGGGSRIENGRLVLPARVASEMARLNNALDRCYLANGATRVPLDRGWTYDDPHSTAQRACAQEQQAVNTFGDGPEMAAAERAAAPLLAAFWNCVQASKAVPYTSAFDQVVERCSREANRRG
jgi:hypothetical protein